MPKTNPKKTSTLMVRLDEESKEILTRAAELRRISVSDYVRQITVAQARREIAGDIERTVVMTRDEQIEFWNALNRPAKKPTPAQKKLGKLMRGEQ